MPRPPCTRSSSSKSKCATHSSPALFCRQQRENLFARENAERYTECPLDRALLKAKNAKDLGALPAPEFHRIREKVEALKKLKFVEKYEYQQDKETYEWIKYKVAADIGGEQEREAFAMYEKIKLDELGESRYRLLRERAHDQTFNI